MKRIDPANWGNVPGLIVRPDVTQTPLPHAAVAARNRAETLLLIEVPRALSLIDRLPRRPSLVITRFSGLDQALIRRVAPDRVICPLVSAEFDAFEVMARLRTIRWQGPVCVIGNDVPDTCMIEEELRAALPGRPVHLVRS